MTEKDKRFAEEYMIDLNATAAAQRAGYSHATARNASGWIKEGGPDEKKALRQLVERKKAERSRRTGVSADRVLDELAKIGFVNPSDVIDFETGCVRADARPEDLAAIAAIKVKDGKISEREVRMADKGYALVQIGKHLGMFQQIVQLQGAVPVILDDDGE